MPRKKCTFLKYYYIILTFALSTEKIMATNVIWIRISRSVMEPLEICIFLGKKSNLCHSRSTQMPLTDQIREIVPFEHTHFWDTI